MPFAGNLRTLPLPDVFQTLNNIKATGVLRLRSNAGSRDVIFQQGEIIGVGFLDKQGREDLDLRIELLGLTSDAGERLRGATWYYTAMEARTQVQRAELDELVHEQAREQLHNLFAWNTAEFAFDESGPGKTIANELVAHSLERPLSIDTATILLEAARQQDEWADLRARIRDEAGVAAMGSSPTLGVQQPEEPRPTVEDRQFHLYLDGEWRGPFPRSQIVGLVQTGEVPSETWSYDPRTQDRKTLDQLLGAEARRITPDELESLRQAVQAADDRLTEERAGRAADLAELRGLASEVLRLARDCQLNDPSIGAVVERLAEVANGDDPSIVALAAETVIVALVRHLRDLGQHQLEEARAKIGLLEKHIIAANEERSALEVQLSEAERRTDAERDAAAVLRERLAAAADDASRLDQELERSRKDPSRASTARIGALSSPEDIAGARNGGIKNAELQREIGRMRAEHARLLNEVATLQTRLDEDRSRHEAELEASRALAGSLSERKLDPPTEAIGQATDQLQAVDAALAAEVARLKGLLAQAESNDTALEARRAAAQRDAARGDTERLRRDLHAARAEAARAIELAKFGEQADARVATAEAKAASAAERAAAAEQRIGVAETALAEARVRLQEAEVARREQERAAYDAARQNSQLQIRMQEMVTRLEQGEARLGELGDLSTQLADARRHAAALEAEAARFRSDLAEVRKDATGKLDRAKRRVDELRDRLREAKRDRHAPVPWSSPMTAAFTPPPPPPPQVQVPWPSPATATYIQTPGQAPVPWPSPATAVWGPQGSWPVQAPPPQAQQPGTASALSPNGAAEPAPGANVRTTSGTFVPMPMPEDSSAGRPRVQLPATVPEHAPTAMPRSWSPVQRWSAAIAAGSAAGVALLWWGAASAVPICERATVNGRIVEVTAPIAGTVRELQVRDGQQVTAGTRLARLWNDELNRSVLDGLRQQELTLKSRLLAQGETLRQAQQTHDRLVQEMAVAAALAAQTPPPAPITPAAALPDPRERLRQEFAARISEISGNLDDLRAQMVENETRRVSEERRLDSLRQADLVSPVDGIVHVMPNDSESFAAGRQVFTLIDSSSLVIDAELPIDVRLAIGDPAFVRFGNDQVEATVQQINPSANETRRLALSPTASAGSMRVLLMPRDPGVVQRRFQGQARIAFPGANPSLFGWLGLKLRF